MPGIVVRFSLAGGGVLIDNQGTSTGSRVVQLYNGRAQISIRAMAAHATAGRDERRHRARIRSHSSLVP